MTSKTTVVTMYFNIRNFADATEEVRPKSFYMEKGRATLSLNAPMVIFCDDTCYEDIKSIRDAAFPDANKMTTYIIKPLIDYDFYKYSFPVIQKNRIGNEMYINSRNTSSYFILCMFKIVGIFIAKQQNPYGTPFYAWIDFGGSHILRNFEEYAPLMIANPHPKISLCYIHFRGRDEMAMTSKFSRGGFCGIGATAFTAESKYIDQFYNGTMGIYHEMLANTIGHADEQVLTHFHYRYPELCTLYYGDYYSILSNYHALRDDYTSVKHHFINEALAKGRQDLASVAAKTALISVKNGTLQLNEGEVAWLNSIG